MAISIGRQQFISALGGESIAWPLASSVLTIADEVIEWALMQCNVC
jgi:hypothetical protein